MNYQTLIEECRAIIILFFSSQKDFKIFLRFYQLNNIFINVNIVNLHSNYIVLKLSFNRLIFILVQDDVQSLLGFDCIIADYDIIERTVIDIE